MHTEGLRLLTTTYTLTTHTRTRAHAHAPVSTMTPSQSKRRAKRGLVVLDEAAARTDAPRAAAAAARRLAAEDPPTGRAPRDGTAAARREATHCCMWRGGRRVLRARREVLCVLCCEDAWEDENEEVRKLFQVCTCAGTEAPIQIRRL
jgi:uncharacterized membrane protein YccC